MNSSLVNLSFSESNVSFSAIFILANRTYCVIVARMIKRESQTEIVRLLEEFPAVGILGPRQVGKTKLN